MTSAAILPSFIAAALERSQFCGR